MGHHSNAEIARKLREYADLLELEAANPYRVRAYRRAADAIASLTAEVHGLILRQGREGLRVIPGIGPGIARAIDQLVRRGRWVPLEKLRRSVPPPRLFRAIPGVGQVLARRIHDTLGAEDLEALELAAYDGRLAAVPGIGPRRAAMIRAALGALLARPRPPQPTPEAEPSVDLLLDVDAEYREKAAANRLPRIAPRRFNPSGEAWLPILHTRRGPWTFTALFSNTPRAHRVGSVGDWVVIHFQKGTTVDGQRTIVTETRGPLAGTRVVRGREVESPPPVQAPAGSPDREVPTPDAVGRA